MFGRWEETEKKTTKIQQFKFIQIKMNNLFNLIK